MEDSINGILTGQSEIPPAAAITWQSFADFFQHFGVNLVAILLLAYALYFRRHGRHDLLMVFVAFNIGLFIVLSVINLTGASLAIGFGLFAILSIIRLRSEPFSNIELGYFFIAMTLAVVNALQVGGAVFNPMNQLFALGLNVVGLLAIYVVDHPSLQRGAGHRQVVLDRVYDDGDVLRTELERRLRERVVSYTVLEADYVRDVMTLDVRYVRRETAAAEPDAAVALTWQEVR